MPRRLPSPKFRSTGDDGLGQDLAEFQNLYHTRCVDGRPRYEDQGGCGLNMASVCHRLEHGLHSPSSNRNERSVYNRDKILIRVYSGRSCDKLGTSTGSKGLSQFGSNLRNQLLSCRKEVWYTHNVTGGSVCSKESIQSG
jgi:hypothetical protein